MSANFMHPIQPASPQSSPGLDLSFERIVEVPKALIWRAWTEPELLMRWFCPLPWVTTRCSIDLRPGGAFSTVMQSPEGQTFPNTGCYLAVVPEQTLIWTNALLPGFRPHAPSHDVTGQSVEFKFTAVIALADHPSGTRYTATVIHADAAGCAQHAAMGFEAGWSKALEQLVALVKPMMR